MIKRKFLYRKRGAVVTLHYQDGAIERLPLTSSALKDLDYTKIRRVSLMSFAPRKLMAITGTPEVIKVKLARCLNEYDPPIGPAGIILPSKQPNVRAISLKGTKKR